VLVLSAVPSAGSPQSHLQFKSISEITLGATDLVGAFAQCASQRWLDSISKVMLLQLCGLRFLAW